MHFMINNIHDVYQIRKPQCDTTNFEEIWKLSALQKQQQNELFTIF